VNRPATARSLAYVDFVPRVVAKRLLLQDVYESYIEAAAGASEWVRTHNVDVVNVETVVLPNMHSEDGSADAALTTYDERNSQWHQFVRVWYWANG
jgi:hypothetical protein